MNLPRITPVRRTLALIAVALVFTTTVGATGTVEEPPATPPTTRIDHSADVRMTDLIGTDVSTDSAPRVGTVADVIVDIGQGALAYLVIRFSDDSIRSSDELFPMPLYLFERREDNGLRLLPTSTGYLENMPTLEEVSRRAASPDRQDQWNRWVYAYWSTASPLDESAVRYRSELMQSMQYRFASGPRVVPTAMLRGSDLAQTPVRDPRGRRIAEINDAVVSLDTGQLLLINVRPAESLDARHANYLIPPAALTGNRETTTIAYDVDAYGLAGPSGFTGEWPDITDDDYHDALARYWNTRDVATRYGTGMTIVPVRLTPASAMTNYDLFTRWSTSASTIADVLVSPDGSIEYAIIEFEEFFDANDQRSAVPVSMLTIQPVSQAAVLDVPVTDMSALPRYGSARAVDTGTEGWDAGIARYWNNLFRAEAGELELEPVPTVASVSDLPAQASLPGSALLGFTVVSASGETLGGIDELRIDLVGSTVAYAVLRLDGIFAEAAVPVTVTALEWRPAEGRIVLDADEERLRNAPGYGDVPVDPELGFVREVEAYWQD